MIDPNELAAEIKRFIADEFGITGGTLHSQVNQLAALAQRQGEPVRPDVLEKLSYHQLERDDMTLAEVLYYLSSGWEKVHGRSERQLVLQLCALLAGTAPATAEQPAEQAGLTNLAKAVCQFIEGDLPTRGWLRDNDGSRAALHALRTAIAATAPAPAPVDPDDIDPDESALLRAAREVITESHLPRDCGDDFHKVPSALWLKLQWEVMERLRALVRQACMPTAPAPVAPSEEDHEAWYVDEMVASIRELAAECAPLCLYEHEDGRHLVTVPGAAILAGDPQWVRVGPVEVQGVDADVQSLFAEALAWGKVYGEALPASQWDEMRDEMASRFAARLASTKKDAPPATDDLGDKS